MNSTNIRIKIDTGTIPVLVKNKKVLKLYCFFLTLKTLDTKSSGYVDYKRDLKELCNIMNISERTFYTRLNGCIYHDILIRYNDGVRLASFGKVADFFKLTHSGKFIEIDANETRLEDQLRAKAIELNLIAQTHQVHKKIKENYTTEKHTPEQIRLHLLGLITAAFITGTSLTNISCTINPDVTLGQFGTAKMFGCTSQSSGHYWQSKLIKSKLLDVENRTVISESNAINKTRLQGKIFWNPHIKKKCLQLRNLYKPFPFAEIAEIQY